MLWALLLAATSAVAAGPADFDRAAELVTQNFYDRTFRDLPWNALVARYRTSVTDPMSEDAFVAHFNSLLDYLHASHTELLASDEQEYWALKSIFSHELKAFPVANIGAWFVKRDARWFVRNVLEGSPAQAAGLLEGDEIVTPGFGPVLSFANESSVQLRVRRSAHGRALGVEVRPELLSFPAAFLRASVRSQRVIRSGLRRIGYFHLWAGTDDAFRDSLASAARDFSRETDAMILDLRDGFGGANPSFAEPFLNGTYTQPLFVLINGGTRSGKEWLAYVLRDRATLVGERTAGYFLGGKPFEVTPDLLLYLAVDGNSPEGVNLEGHGVPPQVEVEMPLAYRRGVDRQLRRALRLAVSAHVDP